MANMDCAPPVPRRILDPADLERPSLLRRTVDWVVASRGHRVLCMLAGLWLINLFDLMLTILAHDQGLLAEANPLARGLLPFGPVVLTLFKLTLVGGASAVLIRYRKRVVSEMTSAVMLLLYAGVAVRWRLCYELYSLSVSASLTTEELETLDAWACGIPIL